MLAVFGRRWNFSTWNIGKEIAIVLLSESSGFKHWKVKVRDAGALTPCLSLIFSVRVDLSLFLFTSLFSPRLKIVFAPAAFEGFLKIRKITSSPPAGGRRQPCPFGVCPGPSADSVAWKAGQPAHSTDRTSTW